MTLLDFLAACVLTVAVIVVVYLVVRSTEASLSVPSAKAVGESTLAFRKVKDKIPTPKPKSEVITKKVDEMIEARIEEIIEGWGLATVEDLEVLEKRIDVLDRRLDELEKRFDEFRSFTRRKLERLEERVTALEREEKKED